VKELAEAKDLLSKLPAPKQPKCRFFLPLLQKGKVRDWRDREVEATVPCGIIAHLTRECGGNVHDCHAVDITSGSFEKETVGANPSSGALDNEPALGAKNAAKLKTTSDFQSDFHRGREDIRHTRNNWLCYDFKERKILPAHYAIRTN
jgi:hypothetical protein